MSESYFTYRAYLKKVVDGDTFDFQVDLGFRTYKRIRVRLRGVDVPEIWGVKKESDEYQKGQSIKNLAEKWMKTSVEEADVDYLTLKTYEETGKYGRWLGDVCVEGKDQSLGDRLLEEESVEEYEI